MRHLSQQYLSTEVRRNTPLKPTTELIQRRTKVDYHSDHLGSSSFISEASGEACQFLAYLPFGEQWVDQHDSYDTPYKFSGKELDGETGYNYFGARYYDSGLSVWLSVDPMADQRSWVSPYSYCQNKPLNSIDPTGALDWKPPTDGSGNWTAEAGDSPGSLARDAHISQSEAEAAVKSENQARGQVRTSETMVYEGDKVHVGSRPGYSWSSGTSNQTNNVTSTPLNSENIDDMDATCHDDISFGLGLTTTLVGGAASGPQTGLVSSIAKTTNIFGGVVGTLDNTIAAVDAFDKGNSVEGVYQATQAAAYTAGTIMLFTPGAPIGAAIIFGNGLVDLGEYFYKNW